MLWNCFKHSKDIIILLNRQSPKCYEKDSLWLHTKREASYHNGYIKFLSVLIFKIWQTYLQNISCDKTCPPPPNYYWKWKTLCVLIQELEIVKSLWESRGLIVWLNKFSGYSCIINSLSFFLSTGILKMIYALTWFT